MVKPIIEVAIENMDEFNELIKKAQKQSSELQHTLFEITAFNPKISYQISEEKQR